MKNISVQRKRKFIPLNFLNGEILFWARLVAILVKREKEKLKKS